MKEISMTKNIIYLSLLLPQLTWAFFCPSNFNQIDFGASTDQVSQQCGKPDKIETTTLEPEGPQEWNYYIPATVASSGTAATQGTMKAQITFDSSGRVVNMSVNGIGVGASTICGGANIQLGDSLQAVKAACGTPSFVNKQNTDSAVLGPPQPKKVITTYFYNSNPPATLVFENGLLTQRK